MKTTDILLNKINRFAKGYVFTVDDFEVDVDRGAIIKSLNRLVLKRKIKKLSKGRYYKVEQSMFGELEPEQYQVTKDLLEKNGKLIGYITGYGIFNQLGLTTQISFVIQIGRNETRPSIKRGKYKIYFVKQKNRITKENIPLLQILDSIRFFKKIPDSNISFLINRFIQIIDNLDREKQKQLIRLSLKYSPSTRALLGALMESNNTIYNEELQMLKSTLNPLTKYNLNITKGDLLTAENWNIE